MPKYQRQCLTKLTHISDFRSGKPPEKERVYGHIRKENGQTCVRGMN